jgi:hypothetical protein
MNMNRFISPMALAAALGTVAASAPAFAAEETKAVAPPAWPRYRAKISKDFVNLRVEPSLRARLAPERAPKGTEISVQRASDKQWLEILDPDEYRGFFVREDMVTLGAQENLEAPEAGPRR